MKTYTVLALFMCLAAQLAGAATVPFWGARQSSPLSTNSQDLKDGEFVWIGGAVSRGPMVVVVDLTSQRGYVYRNGVLIGYTTVSTGRAGHRTPTGVFTVLQKDRDHRSTIYDGAPMPYMERLTWSGVALHAGGLPGYPESHGCVHLPSEFARQLYEVSKTGMTVVIADSASAPRSVTHPGYLAPVDYRDGQVVAPARLQDSESWRWQPDASPTGALSLVLSRSSARIVVYREGVEIGRSRIVIAGDQPFGTHALILAEGAVTSAGRVPDLTQLRWWRVELTKQGETTEEVTDTSLACRIDIPHAFVSAVLGVLQPGATLLITDQAITADSSGPRIEVISADPPHPIAK